MRILTLADDLSSRGGLERVHLELNRGLVQRGHAVDLLFAEHGDASSAWFEFTQARRQAGSRLERRPRGLARSVKSIVGSTRFGLRRRPDVVYVPRHLHLAHAVSIGALVGAPVVCHIHTPPPRETLARRHGLVFGRVTRFAIVSDFTAKQWIEAGLSAPLVKVVHNGVDVEALKPLDDPTRGQMRTRLGIPPDAFFVLYAGRLDPKKGLETLLRAWRELGLSPDQGRLGLLGAPSTFLSSTRANELLASLHQMADPSTTDFLGHQGDPAPFLGAADVVVVPSLWPEPFGLVVLEAMACATPVVASRVGGIPEVLSGPFASNLVEPGDVQQLAKALDSIRGWRSRDPLLGRRCRRHVEDGFTFTRTLDELEDLLVSAAVDPSRFDRVGDGDPAKAELRGHG